MSRSYEGGIRSTSTESTRSADDICAHCGNVYPDGTRDHLPRGALVTWCGRACRDAYYEARPSEAANIHAVEELDAQTRAELESILSGRKRPSERHMKRVAICGSRAPNGATCDREKGHDGSHMGPIGNYEEYHAWPRSLSELPIGTARTRKFLDVAHRFLDRHDARDRLTPEDLWWFVATLTEEGVIP